MGLSGNSYRGAEHRQNGSSVCQRPAHPFIMAKTESHRHTVRHPQNRLMKKVSQNSPPICRTHACTHTHMNSLHMGLLSWKNFSPIDLWTFSQNVTFVIICDRYGTFLFPASKSRNYNHTVFGDYEAPAGNRI